MDRRTFVKTGAAGTAGFVTLSAVGCGGKSVKGESLIIDGALASLQILFPNLTILSKGRKLLADFSAAWESGQFDNANTFFNSLDTLIGQVISDLELQASTRVKLVLVTLGIGLRALAALIAEQGAEAPKAGAAARAKVPKTTNRVEQLANPEVANQLLNAAKSKP